MEITLTDTKKQVLKACCSELLHKSNKNDWLNDIKSHRSKIWSSSL